MYKDASANIFPFSLLLALPCIHVSCWFNCDISLGEPRLECTAIGIHYKYPWMLRRAKMVIQKSQWDFLSLLHRPKDLYHINHWIYNLDNVLHCINFSNLRFTIQSTNFEQRINNKSDSSESFGNGNKTISAVLTWKETNV